MGEIDNTSNIHMMLRDQTNCCVKKGAMCKNFEYLLTKMQYDIQNYVFSGV